MRPYRLTTFLTTMSLVLSPLDLMAAENEQLVMKQPDEAFLQFLATMSLDDGEMTDPLDMLELSDAVVVADIPLDRKKYEDVMLENNVPTKKTDKSQSEREKTPIKQDSKAVTSAAKEDK